MYADKESPSGESEKGAFSSGRDFQFFYKGLAEGKILVQRCECCGLLRNPPAPMCPECNSLGWRAIEARPQGTVYSYTVHCHPPIPPFPTPHAVVLAEMADGFCLLGALHGAAPHEIAIGMPVTAECGYFEQPFASFRFRKAGGGAQ